MEAAMARSATTARLASFFVLLPVLAALVLFDAAPAAAAHHGPRASLTARVVFTDAFSYKTRATLERKWKPFGSLYNITPWKPRDGAVVHIPSGNNEQSELWTKTVIDLRSAAKATLKVRAKWKLDKPAQDTFIVFVSRKTSQGWDDNDVYHVGGTSGGKWRLRSIDISAFAGSQIKVAVAVSTGTADPYWFKTRGAQVDSIKVIAYR